jgi:hypothetical protein
MATEVVGPHLAHSGSADAPAHLDAAGPAPKQRPRFSESEVPADGQSVIVTARWVLVVSGLILALWDPGPIGQIRMHVLALLLLAVGNFYLHAQLLMRRPAVSAIAYAASAADIAVITLLIVSQGGFASPLYIFYFPALLAFSVAFPTSRTVGFASAVVGLYASISLFTAATEGDVQAIILRVMMLIAVAVCGNMYRRIEDGRRSVAADALADLAAMRSARSPAQEQAEDIFFGQAVMIWARWFIILTGALLTLWTASTAAEITVNTLLIVVLMGMNFFLHGRYLMERPANRTLLIAISLVDLLIITTIVAVWQGQFGLQSHFFVFYYPIALTFAFVLPPRLTVAYTALALLAYAAVCLLSGSALIASATDMKLLVMRLITLAAMGGLGTYYWRIQRQRRRALHGASALDELQARLGQAALAE